MLTCLALVQSGYAATSALTESLLEYEAITSAIGSDPNFQNVIDVTEFIVDIRRLTRQINVLGVVKYEIVTRLSQAFTQFKASDEMVENPGKSDKGHHHRTHTYIARLNVQQNPGIGPNIITVLSIQKVRRDKKTFFEDEELLYEGSLD